MWLWEQCGHRKIFLLLSSNNVEKTEGDNSVEMERLNVLKRGNPL